MVELEAGKGIFTDRCYALRGDRWSTYCTAARRGKVDWSALQSDEAGLVRQALAHTVAVGMDGTWRIERGGRMAGVCGVDTAQVTALRPELLDRCGVDIEGESGLSGTVRLEVDRESE